MLQVFICEDNPKQLAQLKILVNNCILIENYDMKITLSTGDPIELLNYVEEHTIKNALYFLDVDLQHEIDGIILASKLREMDTFGKIIFITTHAELALLVFQYQVEAMDYIIKDKSDEIEKRVKSCIDLAHTHYLDDNHPKRPGYPVKVGEQIQVIPFNEIMFFESHPTLTHQMVLHMENGTIKFRGAISAIEKSCPDFYRCHHSFVVNPKNIKCVDTAKKEIEMVNGETILVSFRRLKELLSRINSQ